MHEFRIFSADENLNDYLTDIIAHRVKLNVIKIKKFPGGVETVCQIAATKKRTRRTKAATAKLHDQVEKLHADGLSNAEIASQIGCSRAYISKILWQ